MGKIERPSVESLIMDFAMSLTRRATCKRAQFSCVITSRDMTQIYSFGYNGTAKGFDHNDCKFDQPGNCQCVHAEVNALIKVRVNDPEKVVFVTGQPCVTCAKAIINSGASKIYYRSAYRSEDAWDSFKRAAINRERVCCGGNGWGASGGTRGGRGSARSSPGPPWPPTGSRQGPATVPTCIRPSQVRCPPS